MCVCVCVCVCAVAGVQAGKLVEAHGSFASASCIQCNTKHNAVEVKVHTCMLPTAYSLVMYGACLHRLLYLMARHLAVSTNSAM